MVSVEFIKGRLQATRQTQANIAAGGTPPGTGWVWSGRTVAQWEADVTTLDQLILDESAKRTAWRSAAALWDEDLAEIQKITRNVAREGAYHFRNNPAKRSLFEALKTDGRGRADVYEQGVTARDAWQEADPSWTYSDEVSLSALSSRLASALAREGTHSNKRTAWRRAAAELMTKAGEFNDACVAWYDAATRKFPAGTAEGDLIRSAVPTTTQPEQPVGQAVISHLMVMGRKVHFDCTAPHATRFTYLHQAPGSPTFVVLFAETTETSVTLEDQPPGLHRFKAFGSSSDGEGPESAVVEITVAEAAAA
jgi:hypothetical protein